MNSTVYISRSVRNPIRDFGKISRFVGVDGGDREEIYQQFVKTKREGMEGVHFSKKEFSAILSEMKAYKLLDFEMRGKEICLDEGGLRLFELIKDKNLEGIRHHITSIFCEYHPQLITFLEKLLEKKVIVIPKPPGAREYKGRGFYFTAYNSEHRKNYIDFCIGKIKELYQHLIKTSPSMLDYRMIDEMRGHIEVYVKNKVSDSDEGVNQKNVVKWTELAIKDFLIKKEFGNTFKSVPEFDVWRDRLFFLWLVNYSPSFPLFNGSIIYPTCTFKKPSDNQREYEHCVLSNGDSIFVNKPNWEGHKSKFAETLNTTYMKLNTLQGISYIKIADIRDMVCYKLKIHDSTFDDFLKKSFRERNTGTFPLRISLDSDIYPGREHWKRSPLLLSKASGKRTIICIM